jgi:polysaccharide transporter, PST family
MMSDRKHGEKIVLANARMLLLIQLANQLLPLILIPYLTRAMGTHEYGVYAFGLALVQLVCMVTDYGFNLSITPEISRRRHDVDSVNKIIGAVFLCKSWLLLLGFVVFLVCIALTPEYGAHHLPFLLLYLAAIGQTYQPLWLFQGVEKMGFITAFVAVGKLIFMVGVFVAVQGPEDFGWLAGLNGASQLIAAGLALLMMKRLGYRPVWPGGRYAWEILKRSTPFFWSRAAVSTYTLGGGVYLGLEASPVQMAYYAAADQVYKGFQSLLNPLAQSIYPSIVNSRDFGFLFRMVRWATAVAVAVLVAGLFLGEVGVALLFGDPFLPAYEVLIVLLIALVVTTPSVLLGYPLMGGLGRLDLANKSVFLAGAMQLLLLAAYALFNVGTAVAVAGTVLAVEIMVLVMRSIYSWRLVSAGSKDSPR